MRRSGRSGVFANVSAPLIDATLATSVTRLLRDFCVVARLRGDFGCLPFVGFDLLSNSPRAMLKAQAWMSARLLRGYTAVFADETDFGSRQIDADQLDFSGELGAIFSYWKSYSCVL